MELDLRPRRRLDADGRFDRAVLAHLDLANGYTRRRAWERYSGERGRARFRKYWPDTSEREPNLHLAPGQVGRAIRVAPDQQQVHSAGAGELPLPVPAWGYLSSVLLRIHRHGLRARAGQSEPGRWPMASLGTVSHAGKSWNSEVVG